MSPNSTWIHLLVPVFQWHCFRSGICDLVTVESQQNNERVGIPTLTDEWALTLVREVTNTDRRSKVCDTTEMCDLNETTTVQCIFKNSVPTLEVYLVWRRNVFKKYKDLQKR